MPVKQRTSKIDRLILFLSRNEFNWKKLVPIILVGIFLSISVILIPVVIGQLFDQMMPDGNKHMLDYLLVLLSILLLAAIFSNGVVIHIHEKLMGGIMLNSRVMIYKKLLTLPPPSFPDLTVEIIYSYFFRLIEELCHSITLLGLNFSRDFLVVIGLLSVMVWLNLGMSLLVITILIIFFLIRQIFYFDADQRHKLEQKQYKISEDITKLLYLRRSADLDGSHEQQIRHIRNNFSQLQSSLQSQSGQRKVLALLSYSLLIGIFTISLYYLLQQYALNQLTIGDMIAFVTAGIMLLFPLQKLIDSNIALKQCNEAIQIIFSLLNESSEAIEDDCHTVCLDRCAGGLKFEGVSAQDKRSRSLLPCFNLEIIPGQKILLVNQDSNINQLFADIVCGFVQPSTGRVLLDGSDIRQITSSELYKHIVWISPDQDLLNDTIAANIAYGSFGCSKEMAITTAAHASLAMEFIQKLPQGLQTKNNNTSQTFSNDQRQRILIARALLKNPSIIILDETMAYFETDNTSLLQALQLLLNNRTSLILSSRLEMRNLADRQFDLGNVV